MSSCKLAHIKIADIQVSEIQLRQVDENSLAFNELCESIATHGVREAIQVRKNKVENEGDKPYILINGLHRMTAAIAAGIEEIPASIYTMEQSEALFMQITTNIQRVAQKPSEVTAALMQLMAINPLLTKIDLAKQLNISAAKIDQLLKISTLPDHIKQAVDNGDMSAINAVHLSSLLDKDDIDVFKDFAATETAEEFAQRVKERNSEVRKARRAGLEPNRKMEFTAIPRLRKLNDIQALIDDISPVAEVIESKGITCPIEASRLALSFAISLDPATVEAKREAFEAEQQLKAEKKAAAEAKRKADKLARLEAAKEAIEGGGSDEESDEDVVI